VGVSQSTTRPSNEAVISNGWSPRRYTNIMSETPAAH
jgi:hypothetical protein